MADFLQVIGEQRCKRFAISDNIIFAFFLPHPQGLFHFLRSLREDIKLVQVGYGPVDDARPSGGVDLHIHVGRRHTGRDPAQAEAHDLGGIRSLGLLFP